MFGACYPIQCYHITAWPPSSVAFSQQRDTWKGDAYGQSRAYIAYQDPSKTYFVRAGKNLNHGICTRSHRMFGPLFFHLIASFVRVYSKAEKFPGMWDDIGSARGTGLSRGYDPRRWETHINPSIQAACHHRRPKKELMRFISRLQSSMSPPSRRNPVFFER